VFNLFRKKPGILAARLVVRARPSWQDRFAVAIIGCVFLAAFGWGMYEAGRHEALEQQDDFEQSERPDDAHEKQPSYSFNPSACRQTKKQKLCGEIGDLTQQLQINTTSNQNLTVQVKTLASENDQLKEKLAFLQHLLSGNNKTGISVYQFSLKETQTSGIYRYALTLLQGEEKNGDFKGNLRFQVQLLQNGHSKTIPLIGKHSKRDFPVNFKSLHRFEESFKVPLNAVVESIQVQIFKNGESKALLTEIAKPAS
jgi:hypothetical protein